MKLLRFLCLCSFGLAAHYGLAQTATAGAISSGTSVFKTQSGTKSEFAPVQSQFKLTNNVFGPGWQHGNAGGWTVSQQFLLTHTVYQRGISQIFSPTFTKHATGDSSGFYLYHYSDGGVTGSSDEGFNGITIHREEPTNYFHGKMAAGAGTGSTAPTLTFINGNNALTDGGILLDISKGTISGNVGGNSTAFSAASYLKVMPTTADMVNGAPGALPLTTSYCKVAEAIADPHVTADAPVAKTLRCTLGTIRGGTPAMRPGIAEISGPWYQEQIQITDVQPPAGGVQTITARIRNPNGAGAVIFQGGLAGQYLSFDANLALSGMRSTYHVFGSLDGVNLIYAELYAGGAYSPTLPMTGNEAATVSGPNSGFHLYPGAEIVSLTSTALTPVLEANSVAWQAGDVVENPHPAAQGGTGGWIAFTQNSPTNSSYGSTALRVDMHGAGIAGGTAGYSLRNYAPDADYVDGGGTLTAPTAFLSQGEFQNLNYTQYGPQHNGALLFVQNLANGIPGASWTGNTDIVNYNSVGCGHFYFTPSTSSFGMCNLAVSSFKSTQIIATGNQPNIAVGPSAGSSSSVSNSGRNMDGVVTVTTGSATSGNGILATINFASVAGYVAPIGCALQARNAAAALLTSDVYTTAPTTKSWTINVGAMPPPGSTTFSWSYHCE